MKTEFGTLTIASVLEKIDEFSRIGEPEFLALYANGRGAKSTWINFMGRLFPAKAIFAAALKPRCMPAAFQTSDTYVFARDLGLEIVRSENKEFQTARSSIDDLDEFSGPELPPRREFPGVRFARDGKVRATVLRRANGKCEYCGSRGFKTESGIPYLETHHIIMLSEQGPDKEGNVIALCANHHREAHFGNSWENLQVQFHKIISNKMDQ
jgi:hypothetical protein